MTCRTCDIATFSHTHAWGCCVRPAMEAAMKRKLLWKELERCETCGALANGLQWLEYGGPVQCTACERCPCCEAERGTCKCWIEVRDYFSSDGENYTERGCATHGRRV